MDTTDTIRRALFEYAFGVTESDADQKAAFLRRVGVPAEQVVEQVLLRQPVGA